MQQIDADNVARFTRMWIIQEVVFNVDVRLMCGSEEISWVRFITALELYQKIRRRSATRINRLTDKLVGIAAISGLWKQHSMFGKSFHNRPVALLSFARRKLEDVTLEKAEYWKCYRNLHSTNAPILEIVSSHYTTWLLT